MQYESIKISDLNRHKRKRKKINQPVTAETLQSSIANNHGDDQDCGADSLLIVV
jgi:hypothetical protein